TLRADNPRLTVRGMRHGRQPWRVVLTRSENLPPRAHLFSDRQAARTLVYKRERLAAVLEDLGRKNLTSVLIEGGGEVLGQALDGRLTRAPSEPRWITSPAARRHAHELRTRVDAVLIGAETLRVDNPRLTVRAMRHGRQPWRVVLTRSGDLPPRAYLFSDRQAARTLVYKRKRLAAVLEDLGKKNLTSVLIEGGGEVLGQALDGRLIDKIQLYLGPMLTGGPVIAFAGRGTGITANAIRLDRVSYRRIGQNICITAYPSPVFAE
ncbi:MAG: hypothetical protein DME72_05010, partial [Verrucomicrobia bacterium]